MAAVNTACQAGRPSTEADAADGAPPVGGGLSSTRRGRRRETEHAYYGPLYLAAAGRAGPALPPVGDPRRARTNAGCTDFSSFPPASTRIPFAIVDAAGQAGGFSVELLRAAVNAMGREVTFRVGRWDQVRQWLETGEVQALPLVGRTPEREALYDFTFPYMTMHGAIVVRADRPDVRTLDDLAGGTVAVMAGDNAEEFRGASRAPLRSIPLRPLRRRCRGSQMASSTQLSFRGWWPCD